MLAVNKNIAIAVLITVALIHNPLVAHANLLGVQTPKVQNSYMDQWNYYNAFQAPMYQSVCKQNRNAAYTTMGLMALMTFFNVQANNKAAERKRAIETARRRDEMAHNERMMAEIHRHQEHMLRLKLAMKRRGIDDSQIKVILSSPSLMNAIARSINNNKDLCNTITVPEYGYFSSTKEFDKYSQQVSKLSLYGNEPETMALEERIKASYSRLQSNVRSPKTYQELKHMLHGTDRHNNSGRDILINQCNALLNNLNEYHQSTGTKFKGFDTLYCRTKHLKEALCRYNTSNKTTLCRLGKEFCAYRKLAN